MGEGAPAEPQQGKAPSVAARSQAPAAAGARGPSVPVNFAKLPLRPDGSPYLILRDQPGPEVPLDSDVRGHAGKPGIFFRAAEQAMTSTEFGPTANTGVKFLAGFWEQRFTRAMRDSPVAMWGEGWQKMTQGLGAAMEKHPALENVPRAIATKAPLTPAEVAAYNLPEVKPIMDQYLRGPAGKTGILGLFSEAADAGAPSAIRQRYWAEIVDSVPDYLRAMRDIPTEAATALREVAQRAQENGVTMDEIKASPSLQRILGLEAKMGQIYANNLDLPRYNQDFKSTTPQHLIGIKYLRQVNNAMIRRPFVLETAKLADELRAKNQHQLADDVVKYVNQDVLGTRHNIDVEAADTMFNAVRQKAEDLAVGYKIPKPSEASGYKAPVTVVEKVEVPKVGGSPGETESMFRVESGGVRDPKLLSREDVMGVEYGDVQMSKAPWSYAVNKAKWIVTTALIPFRVTSGITSVIGNAAKLVSEHGTSKGTLVGAKAYLDYLLGKLSPEKQAFYTSAKWDLGGGRATGDYFDAPSDLSTGPGLLEKVGYFMVSAPDVALRIIGGEAALYKSMKEFPNKSMAYHEAKAIQWVNTFADIASLSKKPMITGNPVWDFVYHLQNASVSQFSAFVHQVNQAVKDPSAAKIAKPAGHLGIYVGLTAAHLALWGNLTQSNMIKKLAEFVIPLGVLRGEAPSIPRFTQDVLTGKAGLESLGPVSSAKKIINLFDK